MFLMELPFHEMFLLSNFFTFGEEERCFHVALSLQHFLKCLQNLLFREQPLLPVLDAFSVGWVRKHSPHGAAAEILLKMTHDPAYSS